jgi:hypothetical protein
VLAGVPARLVRGYRIGIETLAAPSYEIGVSDVGRVAVPTTVAGSHRDHVIAGVLSIQQVA